MSRSEFIGIAELSALTGFKPSTIRNSFQQQRGPLAPILAKLGHRRLGAWRADYEIWVRSQRRLPDPTREHRAA